MNRKLPNEALAFYIGLGPGRSYELVANHFRVHKRTVVSRAKAEGWQDRVAALERTAREKAEQRAGETMAEMDERQLRTAQFLQRKALEALQRVPLDTAMDAVRALKLGLEHERLIRGEPSQRTAITLEATIRSEYERWMRTDGKAEIVVDALPEHGGTPGLPAPLDAEKPEPAAGEDAA